MKKALFLASTSLLMPFAAAADDVLTGDVRLACEALLCLSSGVQPGECAPSLSRYFGITDKKPSKEINKRLNFLNLCPTASETPEMRSLASAIANGAGRCDAAYLNKTLRQLVTAYYCQAPYFGIKGLPQKQPQQQAGYYSTSIAGMNCEQRQIFVISQKLPAYCVRYSGHEYTYEIGVTYKGDQFNGGKWYDDAGDLAENAD